ncbi:hypothetical protein [Mycobacterium europaeum]|nr:hypothetical protein [Mycobacterium europaeum]
MSRKPMIVVGDSPVGLAAAVDFARFNVASAVLNSAIDVVAS